MGMQSTVKSIEQLLTKLLVRVESHHLELLVQLPGWKGIYLHYFIAPKHVRQTGQRMSGGL
jgi:hypothetical protein